MLVEVIYDLVVFPALVALFVIALVQWQAGLARSHQPSRKVDADNRDRTTATLCSSTEEEKRDVEGSSPSKEKQQLFAEEQPSDPKNMVEVSALETSQTEVSVIDESPQVILDASNVLEHQKQDIDRTMPAGCHSAASCSSPSLPLEETTPLELSSSSPTHFLPEVSVVEYEVSVVESGSPDIKPLLPDSIVESTQPDDSREIFEGDASSPQMDSSCPELQDSRLNSGGSSPPAEYAENGRRRFSDNQDYQLEKVQDHQLQEESEFFRHSLPPSMAFPTAPESPVGPGGMYGAASPPGQMVPACSPPSGSYGYGCGYAYASPGVYGPGVYWAGTHAHPGMMIAGGPSPAPGVLMPMYASPEFYGYHGDAYAQQHKSFGGPSTIDRAAAASTQAPCSSPESAAGTIFTADGTTAAAMGPYEQHSYEQICHRLQRQYAGAQRGEPQGQEDAAHQKETKALKQSKKKKQPKFVRQLDYADSPVLESKEDYASSDSEDSSVDEDEDDICDADSKQPSVTCGGPPKKPAILKQRRAAEKLSKPPGLDDSVVDADPSRTASSSNLFKQQQLQHNAAAVRTPYQNGSGTYNGYNSSAGPSTSNRGTTYSRGAAHHHVVQREAPKPRVQKFISTNNYVPPLPSAPPAKRKKIPTAGIIDQNCNSFSLRKSDDQRGA